MANDFGIKKEILEHGSEESWERIGLAKRTYYIQGRWALVVSKGF